MTQIHLELAGCSCPDVYYCPTSNELECSRHGGFDVCCDSPDAHVRAYPNLHELQIESDVLGLYRACSCGRVRELIEPTDGYSLINVFHQRHRRQMVFTGNRPTRVEQIVVHGDLL